MIRFTNRHCTVLAAAAMAAFFLSDRAANGVTFSSAPALNLNIPDNGYDGSLGSMASSTINVSGLAGTITDVNVTFAMDHTFVGDLTIKLISPSGTNVTLLNRPGLVTHDDGSQAGGFSADLSVAFPITFDDQAPSDLAHDAENMGAGLAFNQVIGDTVDDGSPSTYVPDADDVFSEGLGDGLSTYDGELPNGGWTLYIGDSAAGGLGSLDHWSLDIQTNAPAAVPEVNTAALAGLALIAVAVGVVSRRRVLPATIKIRKSKIENGETH